MRLCLLLLAVPAVLASLDWHLSEGDSEDSLMDYISADVEAEELKRNHASLAAQKGWWAAASELTRLSALHGLDIDNELSMAARTIEGSIGKLRKLARDSRPISSTAIAPAHEWAQSPDSVFVNVKYAHKIDAPAAIGVKTDTVDVQASHVKISATHPNKRFLLDLPLSGEIVPEESSWSESSVGRMTLILRKAEVNSTWTGLVQGKKPSNSHIWWVMKEQYEDAMEEAEEYMAKKKRDAARDAAKAKSLEEGPSSSSSSSSSEPGGEGEGADGPEEVVQQVSALEKALSEARKRMDKEAKAAVKALEDDARSQKRQVDEDAKAKKKAIDADVSKRRAELKKASAEAKEAELARVRSAAAEEEEEEL